jgi:hypothetical protein
MIADAVRGLVPQRCPSGDREAARAGAEDDQPRLERGQLDECDLTLKDLALIAESMVRTLEGIYHARPEYPPGAVRPQGPGLVVVPNEPTEPRKTGA